VKNLSARLTSALYHGGYVGDCAFVNRKVKLAERRWGVEVGLHHGIMSLILLSEHAFDVNISGWCNKTPCNLAWAAESTRIRMSRLRHLPPARLTSESCSSP